MKKSEVLKFFDAQTVVILTTMNGSQPETRALINMRNENIAPPLVEYFKKHDRMIFITNTHTDKIKQIRANPTATLYTHGADWSGMMLAGKIYEVLDDETRHAIWNDGLLMYYPDGRDGGDFSVLEFVPESFKFYTGNNFEKLAGKVE
ncbi:MAG: pyridoxamine 5'-phosphate oxidase family protein [Alphaproteobacteria bacterium]|nr:pyridoxamine 5'-phosphate oxidase family protein [Alphaproteobacteria bacterium]